MLSGNTLSGIAITGIVTGIIDGLFSSVLSVAFYHSTVARLFQGVASVLIGPEALKGGTRTMLLGILMHFGVAFAWSIVFWVLVGQVDRIRNLLISPNGVLAISILYGPLIWITMSLVVIPLFAQRPPITYRWWIQFFGHIPFVALPIVACTRRFWPPG
jgi:MFS-type transporter involved in bile tolerance (Atg22 family)